MTTNTGLSESQYKMATSANNETGGTINGILNLGGNLRSIGDAKTAMAKAMAIGKTILSINNLISDGGSTPTA